MVTNYNEPRSPILGKWEENYLFLGDTGLSQSGFVALSSAGKKEQNQTSGFLELPGTA